MKLVRAELRDLFSPDLPDLNEPGFLEGEPFCVPLQADFGAEGEEGQNQFDMLVCNPPWLAEQVKQGVLAGRHYLIVSHFDVDQIRKFLRDLAAQTVGLTWEEVATKLSRFGHWEFEDYQESAWTKN